MANAASTTGRFEFTELYKTMFQKANLIGLRGARSVVPWTVGKQAKEIRIASAINDGAIFMPFVYHDAYITPLKQNLSLVIAQTADNMLENIIGAVYDHAEGSGVVREIHHFLAVISNFYRAFLRAPNSLNTNLNFESPAPPLATFQREMTLDDPTPCTIPAEEIKLLFGGKVGIVILPSTYRKQPVLWSALAHEVGGHDLLRGDRTILPQLESGISLLFDSIKADKRTRHFLRRLWRYWIGEAAADILGILNMGPSYALAVALYTAALNKDLMPSIKGRLSRNLALLELLTNQDREMNNFPILYISPPPVEPPDNIDSHPSDVLRLYTMIGAIEKLEGLSQDFKREYIDKIEKAIAISQHPKKKGNVPLQVIIKGYLQTGPDTWETVEEKDYDLTLDLMQQCAIEIGRYVVTAELKVLENKDGKKQTIQALVKWDDEREVIIRKIEELLLAKDETGRPQPQSIVNWGDDAQLLAGATRALLQNPAPEFYDMVNERLAEALDKSFERDEIWGDVILARVWSPGK